MPERSKAPDEIFCSSCGEPIKEAAEICPHCGVRNTGGARTRRTTTQSTGASPEPVEYTTSVSENWYYGVIGSVAGWLLLFVFAGAGLDGGALMGLLLLGAWILMPISLYYDSQYVRANSEWHPDSALWALGSIFWFVNIVVGAVYLYRRHETMGTP